MSRPSPVSSCPMGRKHQPGTLGAQTRQRGFALVVVLWAGALLALLATAIAHRARDDVVLTRNLVDATDAELAADSGLQYALERVLIEGAQVYLDEPTVQSWEFNGAEIRISVTDELGRIDLNAATEQTLAKMFAAAGTDPEAAAFLAAAVVAHRGENLPGSFQTPGQGRAGFTTIEDLLNVEGMTRPLFDRLYGAVTVYTGRRTPLLDHASPLVAAAMGDDGPEQSSDSDRASRLLEAAEGAATRPLEGVRRSRPGNSVLRFHVEARLHGGAVYAREAIIVVRHRITEASHDIWVWRRAQRRLF